MQEAYQLQRIKYSIYYLRWGTSPGQVWQGGTQGGVPSSRRYPQPGLMGVPEVGNPLAVSIPQHGNPPAEVPGSVGGTQGGVPLARVPPSRDTPTGVPPGWGYPQVWQGTWDGGPPSRGTPWPGDTSGKVQLGYPRWGTPWQGYPPLPGPGWDTPPPPRCGQTDGQTCVKT